MKVIKSIKALIVSSLMISSMAFAQESFKEGVDYIVLKNDPQKMQKKEKVEVREFFWYGCPHCFQTHLEVKSWIETDTRVSYVPTPAPLGPTWDLLSKLYFAHSEKGLDLKLHDDIFKEIHLKRKPNKDKESVLLIIQDLKGEAFAKEVGQKMDSFSVNMKLNQSKQMLKDYKINQTPSFVINNKYMTNGEMARGPARLSAITKFLVDKASKE